ncbi:MAG: FHA domain-containing protein [Fimbriimonadia bacterium]|nr:FHA domain-containing protein [Fimbriimonadia bacterium]
MISKILYLLVLGAIGGALAAFVNEAFVNTFYGGYGSVANWGMLAMFGIISGLLIGALIGFGSGLSLGTRQHALRGMGLGAMVGGIGGLFGVYVGQVFFGSLTAIAFIGGNPLVIVIARTLGWAAFGAFVGLAEGAIGKSYRRARQGALGGLIGGALGGLLFDAIALGSVPIIALLDKARFGSNNTGEVGVFSRMIALTLMGGAIGLFVGILEALSRHAWIRVVMGRNEGKDYPLDHFPARIGRHELADVPLMGDVSVAPLHAEILKQGGQYLLVAHAGGFYNGQPLTQPAPLQNGSQIQIGSYSLQFMEKEGAAKKRMRDQARSPAPPPVSVSPGMCAFCGQRKDPVTGACACAVPTAGSPAPAVLTSYGGSILPAVGTLPATATALRGLDGPWAGQLISIPPQGISVGREAGNGVVIPDGTLSRRHARLMVEGGALIVYDEGSTNGTFVNEQRVSRQALNAGDTLRLGSVRFRVE